MTREEAIRIAQGLITDFKRESETMVDFCELAIKALEQEPCETIKEISKDYKYDTETKDFLVYRHMYTGHEIHIEKPVPRYRLEQQPCNDAISRQAAIDINLSHHGQMPNHINFQIFEEIKALPPVTPQLKIGHWILIDEELQRYRCSECGEIIRIYDYNNETLKENYRFSHCGAKMIELQESEGVE